MLSLETRVGIHKTSYANLNIFRNFGPSNLEVTYNEFK